MTVNHVLDDQPLHQRLLSPLRSATLSLFGDVSVEFKGYLIKASRLRLSQTESTPLPLTSSLKKRIQRGENGVSRLTGPDRNGNVLQQIDKYVYSSENTF